VPEIRTVEYQKWTKMGLQIPNERQEYRAKGKGHEKSDERKNARGRRK
jgi:hypothetical protein